MQPTYKLLNLLQYELEVYTTNVCIFLFLCNFQLTLGPVIRLFSNRRDNNHCDFFQFIVATYFSEDNWKQTVSYCFFPTNGIIDILFYLIHNTSFGCPHERLYWFISLPMIRTAISNFKSHKPNENFWTFSTLKNNTVHICGKRNNKIQTFVV